MKETDIKASWQKNAAPWAKAIDGNEIESRRLITNQAIIAAVAATRSTTVLDIGCGEGWLARELVDLGLEVTGIDMIGELIDIAKASDKGSYRQLAYEDLSAATLNARFDVAVANFSLLGDESVTQVFQALPALLNEGGHFIVQTLNPQTACGELPYRDGWREGSWAGFSSEFSDPAPWYFRTLESWLQLFSNHGLEIVGLTEPVHPATGKPVSLIVIGKLRENETRI